jgi:hypothetical protein
MTGPVFSPKPVPYMQRYADVPDTSYGRFSAAPAPPPYGGYGAAQEEDKIYALVIDLMDGPVREQALLELSKKREQYDELALVLWHSFGARPAWSVRGGRALTRVQGSCRRCCRRSCRCTRSCRRRT